MIIQTTEKIEQPKYVSIDNTNYVFYSGLMVTGTVIIGWFIKSAFNGLTESNKDLKNSIEKLAKVTQNLYDDLNKYKVEASTTYATKNEMRELKDDLSSICALRHNRRADD